MARSDVAPASGRALIVGAIIYSPRGGAAPPAPSWRLLGGRQNMMLLVGGRISYASVPLYVYGGESPSSGF